MAQWKQALEPYVKVIESVKTAPLNPTAGEDLIIGAVIISDAGPGVPTLITSQKEFLATYAGQELTQKYTTSLNDLYTSDPGSELASTMWLNAYRLSGSGNLLVSRATKKGSGNYVKSLGILDNNDYIIKDTEILRKVNKFRLTVDTTHSDGWALAVNEVGVIGNLVNDEGSCCDFIVDNIPDLVEMLNETTKFFSPDYTYLKVSDQNNHYYDLVSPDDVNGDNKSEITGVIFNEVYLSRNFLDTSWTSGLEVEGSEDTKADEPGYAYVLPMLPLTGSASGGDSGDGTQYTVYQGICDPNTVEGDGMFADLPVETLLNTQQVDLTSFTIYDGQIKQHEFNASQDRVFLMIPQKLKLTTFLTVSGSLTTDLLEQGNIYDDWNTHEPVEIEGVTYNIYSFRSSGVTATNKLNYHWTISAQSDDDGSDTPQSPTAEGEVVVTKDNIEDYSNYLVDLNSERFSGFVSPNYFATNVYNTSTDIRVRIRRFNHNAVTSKDTSSSLESPWVPNILLLKKYTKNGEKPVASVLHYDFYEFAVLDPSISDDWQLFNVGNISGRGDITIAELNSQLGYLNLTLPDDLYELGLNYWNNLASSYLDEYKFEVFQVGRAQGAFSQTFLSLDDLYQSILEGHTTGDLNQYIVDQTKFYVQDVNKTYILTNNGVNEINVNVAIDPKKCSLLNVSDADIMGAWDKIEQDERYVVEGICDLGNTYSIIQNYMANIAVNSNYFYPVSCVFSTNYLTIAAKASKIVQNSHKLWFGGNYDIDDGTVGFRFYYGSSALFWESVMRNRRNNNEFAGVFGQNTGIAQVVNLSKDFSKKERELLLGYPKHSINTVFHDLYIDRYYWNDNKTGSSEETVLSEDCNARFQIRISKAMPVLLNQFKGRQNTAKTWAEIENVIDYWFKTVVLAYNYTINDYRILCSSIMADRSELIRQGKVNVKIQVRFNSSIKYITVYNDAYPIGVDFENE